MNESLSDSKQLIARLTDPSCDHDSRARIGDQLNQLGDSRDGVGLRADGLPDISWCSVPLPDSLRRSKTPFLNERGEEYGRFTLEPFAIARYPITVSQFQAFLDAPDGFASDRWWRGLIPQYRQQPILKSRAGLANQPRDSVSWVQAIAFTRWLTARLEGESLIVVGESSWPPLLIGKTAEIRLPLEWEWQFAAQGADGRAYPWGNWNSQFANTREARLGRSTAVGMYPHGAAWCGALDMSGTLWEWCLNEYKTANHISPDSPNARVLRGGSFADVADWAVCGSRFNDLPNRRLDYFGFRLVCGSVQPMYNAGIDQ